MLQNCVMDEIFAKEQRESCFVFEMIRLAYNNTVTGSVLRKAIMELMVYKSQLGDGDNSIMALNRGCHYTIEILQDVVKELNLARENKVPFGKTPKRDKCFFHVHSKGEHC
jgi:hypothetical protein